MAKLVKSIYTGAAVTALGEITSTDQLEGRYAVEVATLTDGPTINIDLGLNQNFEVVLGGARTFANPTNAIAGQTGSIFITQDATGGRSASFGTNWKFPNGVAPTLSSGANAVDRIDYIIKSATEIHAVLTKAYA